MARDRVRVSGIFDSMCRKRGCQPRLLSRAAVLVFSQRMWPRLTSVAMKDQDRFVVAVVTLCGQLKPMRWEFLFQAWGWRRRGRGPPCLTRS